MRDEDPDNLDDSKTAKLTIWQILRAQFALVGLLANKMPKLMKLMYTESKHDIPLWL